MPATIDAGVTHYQLEITAWKNIAGLKTSPAANNPTWTPFALSLVAGSTNFLDGTFLFYVWDTTSAAADDGVNVIKPTAITGAGRWRLAAGIGAGIIIPGSSGVGSPEGVVSGSPGNIYVDTATGNLYKKVSGANTTTGWV